VQIDGDGTDGAGGLERHRRTFGLELQGWRRRRGMSLRRLGELIPCSVQLVHQVSQGEDWPSPWMLARADWCLGADGRLVEAFVRCWLDEELERSARPDETRRAARHHLDDRLLLDPEEVGLRVVDTCSRIVAAVASWTPEMKRRAFVRWSIFGAASLPAAVVAGGLEGMEHLVAGAERDCSADTVAVEQLRDTIGVCRRLDDLGMSATALQVGRRALVRADGILHGCTSAEMRRMLTLIAGELCQLVGYVAAGLQDQEMAERCTARAIAAADEAGSPELHAYTMGLNLAYTELYCRKECNMTAAAAAVTAAQQWARLSRNPAVVSHAHSVAARVHARAGHETAALHALDQAERYLERSAPEDRPPWLYWYDRAMLLSCRGQCAVSIHRERRVGASRVDEKLAAFHAAIAARTRGYPRDQAGDHLDLSDVYWEHGERDESARHANDALVLAAGMEWRRLRERLEEYRGRMEGEQRPAAREFTERFRALLSS
jgi:hypothetical protein